MSTNANNNTISETQQGVQIEQKEQGSAMEEVPEDIESQLLPSHILQILKEENRPAIEAEKLHEHFKHLSFFEKLRQEGGSQINDLLLHEVWRNVEFTQLPANQLIFKEKEPSNNKMYIILSGKIGISVKPLQEETLNQNNDNNGDQTQRQSKKGTQPKDLKSGGQNDSQQNTHRTDNNDLSKVPASQSVNLNNQIQQDEISTPSRLNQGKLNFNQLPVQDVISSDSSENDSDDESFENEAVEYQPFPELGKKVAELDSGKAFGEQALFKEGGFRNASVYTLEPTRFLVIWREKFLGVLGVIEQIKQDKVQRIGNVIPFFNDIVSKVLKDRLIYLFEDFTSMKGNILTQENVKGQYIYVLKSGRVALEKSIILQEYKEKECLETKTVQLQHRFSEFASAELIGDEILEEKSKIYLNKKNLRPSEYLYTSIVLSSEATFLRLNKKKVIEGFPKYIVEKLREHIQSKKATRKAIVEDYVQKVQPNFKELQMKQINMKKNLVSKLRTSNNAAALLLGDSTPLSQNSSPSKKVQFQNIVRNSILPQAMSKKDYSLEANKSLIKELQIIKLKRQKSVSKKEGDLNFQSEGSRNSLNSLTQLQSVNGNEENSKGGQRSNMIFSQQNSLNSHKQEGKSGESSNHDIDQIPSYTQTSIQQGGQQKSQFSKNKPSITQSISLTEMGLQDNPNYFTSNGFSNSSHQNYLTNNLNISTELYQEFASANIKSNSQNIKLRLSQSIPSLTTLNKAVPQEYQPMPVFIYSHANNKGNNKNQQKQQQQTQKNQQKQPQDLPSTNYPNQQQLLLEKQRQEAHSEERRRKLETFKSQQKSQISKKIDCDVMKKEIIYHHMTTLKEYKQIDPFEDLNSKRQKQLQKEIQRMYQKTQNQSTQSLTQFSSSPTRDLNKLQKLTETSEPLQNKTLHPIKETNSEELTSKQFIILSNGNNNNTNLTQNSVTISETSNGNSSESVTQATKQNKLESKKGLIFRSKRDEILQNNYPMTDRSKSTQAIGSTSILQDEIDQPDAYDESDSETDEDRIQKKLQLLSGKHKKKFYLLLETWDMGIENLKMKELDLRNGLYRKGMIHKPPHEQIHRDYFEKLDEHQLKTFQKYLNKKKRQKQKEVKQMSNLVTMIQPQAKTSTSPDRLVHSEPKDKLNTIKLMNSLDEIESDNNETVTTNTKQGGIQRSNTNINSSLIDLKQQRILSNESKQLYQSASLSSLVTINGQNNSNNFNVQSIKVGAGPNNILKQHFQRYQQLNHPSSLALPQISPSKKIVQKHIQFSSNENENKAYNSYSKAKTEGDFDHDDLKQIEMNNSSYGISKLSKQIQSLGEKQKTLRSPQELTPSQNSNIINYLISPNKQTSSGLVIRNNVIPVTERYSKDSQLSQRINNTSASQLPNIVYNTNNSYKNSPNQEINNNNNKFKPTPSKPQLQESVRYSFLNKFSSISGSNLGSPNGNQSTKMKQQIFLSPTTSKLLQKQ